MKQPLPFEADIYPETNSPRLRINFANGWSASIVLRNLVRGDSFSFDAASLACCPTGCWRKGQIELGEQEATPEEVADYLAEVAARGRP